MQETNCGRKLWKRIDEEHKYFQNQRRIKVKNLKCKRLLLRPRLVNFILLSVVQDSPPQFVFLERTIVVSWRT